MWTSAVRVPCGIPLFVEKPESPSGFSISVVVCFIHRSFPQAVENLFCSDIQIVLEIRNIY